MVENTNSFKHLITSLCNVVSSLFSNNKTLFIVIIVFVGELYFKFIQNSNLTAWGLSFLILFLSIIVYAKNNKFSESSLTFLIGLFTFFTVSWNKTFTAIFIVMYVAFIIITFFISSIKISAKVESILTQAAGMISDKTNYNQIYKILQEYTRKHTNYRQLNIIERAETVRFLVFMKIPYENMTELINLIESIKVVFLINLNTAHDFFRSLNSIYLIEYKRNINKFDMEYIFSNFLDMKMKPEETIEILCFGKNLIANQSFNFHDLFQYIIELNNRGFDKEYIINNLRKRDCV